jgi:hypothetical protein
VETGSIRAASTTTQSRATGNFLKVDERARIGGHLCDGSFSETARYTRQVVFCAFFSGPEIPFPGNGEREGKRLGSNPSYAEGSPSIWCCRDLEIPFPGNRDPRTQRRGSNAQLPRRKSEHLVLPGPFGRHVAEAGYSHAMGEPALDGRFDEIGREKCKRDRHVDLADRLHYRGDNRALGLAQEGKNRGLLARHGGQLGIAC